MRYSLGVLAIALLLVSPACADPPNKGALGTLTYENGFEPERFACDRLDLIRAIYNTRDLFQMRAKFDELVRTMGIHGEPQCLVGRLGEVKVLERPVFLGPIYNPTGSAKLFFWAIHVDDSPKGGTADYWVLYLDTVGDNVGL